MSIIGIFLSSSPFVCLHRFLYPAVPAAPTETGYSEQSLSQAPPGAAEVPYGHHNSNGAVHGEAVAPGPKVTYTGNGYIGNGYSEVGYNGNGSVVVSLNGNGSTTSYVNGNGSPTSYGNGSVANGSYSPGDHQGHETGMQFVRRRLLPVLPTGGEPRRNIVL